MKNRNIQVVGAPTTNHSLSVILPMERYLRGLSLATLRSINQNSPGTHVTLVMPGSGERANGLLKALAKRFPSLSIAAVLTPNLMLTRAAEWMTLRHLVLGCSVPSLAIRPGTIIRGDIASLRLVMDAFDLMIPKQGRGMFYCGTHNRARTWLVSAPRSELNALLNNRLSLNGARYSDLKVGELPAPLGHPFQEDKRLMFRWRLGKIDRKNICIIAPRIDLPFKEHVPVGDPSLMVKRQSESVRMQWHLFPKLLEKSLAAGGASVERIVVPVWEITPKFVKGLKHDLIFIPHRDASTIKDRRAVFYMQEVLPNFFTVDRSGWAAGSSRYGSDDWKWYVPSPLDNARIERLRKSRATKFLQDGKPAPTPKEFVFLPLQLPYDEVIKRDLASTYAEMVAAILQWAISEKRHIILKKHPFGKDISYIPQNLQEHPLVHIVKTGHVHDYIKSASAVLLANSGVGFEAILHNKPVINFGRAMYDAVTYFSGLGEAEISMQFKRATGEDSSLRRERYYRFLSWYFASCGTFVDDGVVNLSIGRLSLPASGAEEVLADRATMSVEDASSSYAVS